MQDILLLVTDGQEEIAKVVLEHLMAMCKKAEERAGFVLKMVQNMVRYKLFVSKEGLQFKNPLLQEFEAIVLMLGGFL